MKKCSHCGKDLPINEFHKNRRKSDGLQRRCKSCMGIYSKTYYRLNIDYLKQKGREYGRTYRPKNKERCRTSTKKYKDKIRMNVLSFLSNNSQPKCMRCGFSDIRALQIDHVNGGGNLENSRIGNGKVQRQILQMPQQEAYSKYQILCANCNWIKRSENGEVKKIGTY